MKEGGFYGRVCPDPTEAVDTDDASSTLEAAARMIAAGVELRAVGFAMIGRWITSTLDGGS